MGYTTSTVHGIEVPDSSEANNVPEDIGKVVTALEAGSLVRRLTGAQIAALTSPQKPAGLVVYNTTTNRLQISDGTNFADLDATAVSALGIANAALPKAGGTMSGAIAMGGSKVTGLAAATANGDAVRYEQLTPKLDSARVKSGVWSGTTDASGYVTITLPESPTGSWAVIVMEANASLRLVSLIGATSTSAVVRVMYTNGTDLLILASSSVTLHYIAIAY